MKKTVIGVLISLAAIGLLCACGTESSTTIRQDGVNGGVSDEGDGAGGGFFAAPEDGDQLNADEEGGDIPPSLPPAKAQIKALAITTNKLPKGVVGQEYQQVALAASGGTGEIAWSVDGLPGGLVFDQQSHTIAGTPTEPGEFKVNIAVRDASGQEDHKTRTLNVADTLAVTLFKGSGSTWTALADEDEIALGEGVKAVATGHSKQYSWEIAFPAQQKGEASGDAGMEIFLVLPEPTAEDQTVSLSVTAKGKEGDKASDSATVKIQSDPCLVPIAVVALPQTISVPAALSVSEGFNSSSGVMAIVVNAVRAGFAATGQMIGQVMTVERKSLQLIAQGGQSPYQWSNFQFRIERKKDGDTTSVVVKDWQEARPLADMKIATSQVGVHYSSPGAAPNVVLLWDDLPPLDTAWYRIDVRAEVTDACGTRVPTVQKLQQMYFQPENIADLRLQTNFNAIGSATEGASMEFLLWSGGIGVAVVRLQLEPCMNGNERRCEGEREFKPFPYDCAASESCPDLEGLALADIEAISVHEYKDKECGGGNYLWADLEWVKICSKERCAVYDDALAKLDIGNGHVGGTLGSSHPRYWSMDLMPYFLGDAPDIWIPKENVPGKYDTP